MSESIDPTELRWDIGCYHTIYRWTRISPIRVAGKEGACGARS
ncbi:MAG: hypothetical protein SWH78_17130 [Thermodesulfobacteriota bacterium]|nr:hypothetical protein [Thermodesulfobacteriota bacterium]